MKKKDLIYLVLAAGIFLAAGYIIFTQLTPKSSTTTQDGVQVEKVGVISPDYDTATLTLVSDSTKVKDFSVPIDLTAGLKNTAPFGK